MKAVANTAEARTSLFPGSYAVAIRTSLLAVVLVGAMVPWYTLRLFPLVKIGQANINFVDALAACTVLIALPSIVRTVRRGPHQLWPVCAFMAYMTIPLVAGLLDPGSAFFAIREARALAFYALALAFVAGGFDARMFGQFSWAYVGGTLAAIVAVFAHVRWLFPLPGYPDRIVNPAAFTTAWLGVKYLEWTVPVVAFTLSVVNALAARRWIARMLWTAASLAVAWYALATTERFMQILICGVAVVLVSLLTLGASRSRRLALLIAAVVTVGILGLDVIGGPAWLSHPAQITLWRWSHWASDSSLTFRIEEITGGFTRFARHPLFGEGLGGIVLPEGPNHSGGPWRYASSGYWFLLVKTGLVGLVLYLSMAAAALRRGWRRLRQDTHQEPWPVTVTGTVGLTTLLAFNLLYPTVDTPEGAVAFSLFFGMLVSSGTAGSDAANTH